MSIEQLIVLAAIGAVYALLRWAGQRVFGPAQSTTPKLREGYPAREPDTLPRAAFEPVKKVEPESAPPSVQQVPSMRRARGQPSRVPRSVVAPPAQPGVTSVTLRAGDIVPRNQADLRRAMALVAILNPPRALDPPR